MSRSDDLAPLFGGEPSDVGFAQGVVVAWDEATGTNAVNVKGTVLTDLPCLNLGEFVILEPEDVVGLLRFKSTYFILGRIIMPQGPDNNRASVGFKRGFAEATNFALTSTPAHRATVTIDVPTWADEAIVMSGHVVQAEYNGANPTGDYMTIRGRIETFGGAGANFLAVAPGAFASGSVIHSESLTSLGSTISVQTTINSISASWGAADALNYAGTNALAIFLRTD